MKRLLKPALIIVPLLVAALLAYAFWPVTENLSTLLQRRALYNVRILRDTWGVPHIYGVTDADTAYGLAYAHAEDDFLTIQQTLLAGRSHLAIHYGPDSAPADYLGHLTRVQELVDAKYATDLSPELRLILTAYADGLNVYAAKHPRDVFPGLFPVTGKDIIAAAVFKAPLFFGLDGVIGELYQESSDTSGVNPFNRAVGLNNIQDLYGSNVFAVAPARTAAGQTFLNINSHQPWTGPVAWYEAHLHSEEGWDMVGGTFPGVPIIIHGHNRHLGWAFTVNHPDLIDVYQLELNPDNPNQYRYDGAWRDLEVHSVPINVQLLGRITAPFPQETLWSVYGPTLRRPHGTYALRYAGFDSIGLYEQLYRMNKAQNFAEWQTAMRLGQMPMFNVGYADRQGNIAYFYNGLLPIRNPAYDWQNILPGDTSETLWTDYLPFDQLPQVINPASGFIQNSNNSPYTTTLGTGNPDPAAFAPAFGIETQMSNRALRALELFGASSALTYTDFSAIKYDMAYSVNSDVARWRDQLIAADLTGQPDPLAAQKILKDWDLRADPESTGATLMILTLRQYLTDHPGAFEPSLMVGDDIDSELLKDAFVKVAVSLTTTFERVDVAWGDVNRLRRGTVDLSVGGGPDTLHALYGQLDPDGRLHGVAGDSFVMLVQWDKDGNVSAQSIHQFGTATLNETSPHYADQAPLFARRQLKPVWYTEAEILAHLEREYVP